jgi:hypothetical protein
MTPDSNWTTAAGEPMEFTGDYNSTLTLLNHNTCPNAEKVEIADIVTRDILFKNGVLHIVNRMFQNEYGHEDLASSAYVNTVSRSASPLTL